MYLCGFEKKEERGEKEQEEGILGAEAEGIGQQDGVGGDNPGGNFRRPLIFRRYFFCDKICQRSEGRTEEGLGKTRGEETVCATADEQVDQRQEGGIERRAEGGFHAARGVVVHRGEVKVHVGFEQFQVGGGVPAESVPRREAARQHVVLEHVVQADAEGTRQKDGNQPEDEGGAEYAQREGNANAAGPG